MAEMHRTGTELELLMSFIDMNRRTVLWKLEGLSEEQARRRVVGSKTNLLGIVNHLAHVERWWVQDVIDGRDVDYPWTDDDPDAEWIVAGSETIASVTAFFEAETAVSDVIMNAQDDLDRVIDTGRRRLSVRWILMHLIEEIARHAGHADIVRELIDETTGYFPGETRPDS